MEPKIMCGFNLKVSFPLPKTCKWELHQDSEVFCESEGYCSMKAKKEDK
jgi:hypothetical protein